jgi:hypothetical protein
VKGRGRGGEKGKREKIQKSLIFRHLKSIKRGKKRKLRKSSCVK